MIAPIVSRVRRYASVETTRKMNEASATTGMMRNVSSASCTSRSSRITIVPTSVSVEVNSVTTESVTSESSACTSFVMREMSTPVWRVSKKPTGCVCRCPKIRIRRSRSARSPTQFTRKVCA